MARSTYTKQSVMQPHYWDDAKAHLTEADPKLGEIIARYKGETLVSRGDGFTTILRSIIGQQISVKAADSVWKKFSATVKELKPEFLLAADEPTLRAAGLSGQKVKYIHHIAERVQQGFDFNSLNKAEDEEVIRLLTEFKGIGRWTAEMYLIFVLLRPDVFPIKDLGLLKGIDQLYGYKKRRVDAHYIKLAKRWQPYRTVATWYLWRSLDPVPVEY